MKVLHVLESSIPDTGGYTIRARSIIEQQRRLGLEVAVITSPLFPTRDATRRTELHDGVRYHRTNHIPAPSSARSKVGSYLRRMSMLRRYRRAVLEVVGAERPDIIHAHSSYTNAYAALPAARRFNLPLIYEVRTLWGESAVIEDGLRIDSWKYRLIWRLELGAMRRADAVVPISQGIRAELVRRGVDAGKMSIVPNGVDTLLFQPLARDEERMRKYSLNGNLVVGFIGSMRRLEGLATLVEAYALARKGGAKLSLVLVGDGPDKADLEVLAARLGLKEIVFTGNVPHTEVSSWYSVMDVLVYPRIRATINERVTPLKPLEAMALGKVCVGSDVGGLLELIRDDRTGVIFPSGDSAALAQALAALANDRPRLDRLGAAAIEFVKEERDWSAIIPRTRDLYERLIRAKAAAGPGRGG